LKSSTTHLSSLRALVTGATGGIGRAIVSSLVDSGIKVIAAGQNTEKLAGIAEEHPGVATMAANLRNGAAVVELANDSLKQFGGIDILINNAGIGVSGNVVDLEIDDYEAMLAVNLRAPFILSKIIGKSMAEAGFGYIINIGSGASYTPIAGMASYCATKYGLLGFSESLALELREQGVKVTIITPGSTASGFGGGESSKKLANKPGILLPEDIADTVMYILNQSGRAWTSQVNLRPLNPNKRPKY